MKRAAVFFDRDNTLIANDGYLGDPRGVVLVDGAANAVARARALGYAVVVFSNQSGVARGMFGEEAVHAVNHRLDEMLLDDNAHAVIDRHEFCPYHPEATEERYRQDSDLRKPKPGMLLQAERQLALDLSRSWVVGDAPRDIDAGKAVGCRTVLVRNESLPESPAARENGQTVADFEVASLDEAMEVIARHRASEAEPVIPPSSSKPLVDHSTPPAARPEEAEPAPIPLQPEIAKAEASAEALEAARAADVATSSPSVSDASEAGEIPRPLPRPRKNAARREATEEEADPQSTRGKSRQEILLGQILDELRRRNEHPENDFSVSKLMAGVVQIIALAAVIIAYVKGNDPNVTLFALLTAIFLQVFTISLLIMGRQK